MDVTDKVAAPITLLQTGAVISLGIGGTLITALQPVLLGAMVQDGRLSAAQLGHAATAELAGMGLLAALAGANFEPRQLRLVALLAVLAAFAANLTTIFGSGVVIVAARFFAGCSSGVLLWLIAGLLVRAASPARLVGIYTASQSILALALAALCGQVLVPRLGGSGAFCCLLALNVIMAGLCVLAPAAYAPIPADSQTSATLAPRAWFSLAAVAAFMGGLVGLWVYVTPLLAGVGAPTGAANATIDASLACQILGGMTAAWLGQRVSYSVAISVTAVAGIAVAATLSLHFNSIVYVAAGGLFGFVWMVAVAYMVPFVIAADPSRRAAMFVSPAQLVGASLAPLLASLTMTNDDARGAAVVSASCFALSFFILWGVQFRLAARSPTFRL